MVLLGLNEVVAAVDGFAARLAAEQSRLNKLNVFPVADSDTGTNMVHTLRAIVDSLRDVDDLAGAIAAVEGAALDGRGNSGLIIGQFLAGFVAAGDGDDIELALGVRNGSNRARMAVASPVEGTILTVADAAAAHLQRNEPGSLDDLVAAVRLAVEATPSQLPLLAERGVVDSGAAGLLCFFEAVRSVFTGPALQAPASASSAVGGAAVGGAAVGGAAVGGAAVGGAAVGGAAVGGAAATSLPEASLVACEVGVGPGRDPQVAAYEIQFRVASEIVGADELSQLLLDLGTDVVVASSALERSAHVHVSDPDAAAAAISFELETVRGAKAISYEVEAIHDAGAVDGEAS